MCEWLSRQEWCDARLLCGGRAFPAHRAVLASVSPFLRRILLSCPIEDTPTLIVLPEFDLEALSAVLYYIYNGEVTMPREKIEKFMDIVKAMQIYIDREYLTQLSVDVDIDLNVKKCMAKDIFILRADSGTDTSIITLRKSLHTFHNKDTDKDCMQARNRNEHFKSVLGNLQSHGDRQRGYFLRDSFMETYPRNRNGREFVPVIPNAYLSPTSLLTNANVGHLSPDTENSPSDASQACLLSYQDNMALSELRRLSLPHLSDPLVQKTKLTAHRVEIYPLGEKHTHSDSTLKTYVTATTTHSIVTNKMLTEKLPAFSGISTGAKFEKPSHVARESQKMPILNKALDSPWCPRLPNSFRPFRRKGQCSNKYHPNDDNNNVQCIPSTVKDEPSEAPTYIHNSSDVGPILEDNTDNSNSQAPRSEPLRIGRYACTECGKTFSQLRNYKYHVSVHRGTREFAASCAVCGKSFNDRGYLSSHMKIHRNRKEYKCSQCPKSFNQRVAYNMHVRIHTGVKPHVCPTCGKAFSRKMLLKQHQRTHSGERPYACPHCEKRFADRSNMTLHLRLHTGVKPFKCPMCPKSFTKKHHLKSHVNFHTGAKPYSCPRCRLAFTQSSNMRTHLKRCTAPEPVENPTETTRSGSSCLPT